MWRGKSEGIRKTDCGAPEFFFFDLNIKFVTQCRIMRCKRRRAAGDKEGERGRKWRERKREDEGKIGWRA